MLLQLNNISLSYGNKTVLNNLNLELHSGDITGIIGVNGEGKTTLLKIISHELSPDNGSLNTFPANSKILYHKQFFTDEMQDQSVENFVMSLFSELYELYRDINALSQKTDSDSIRRMMELQQEFSDKNGYEILGDIDVCLGKLGLSNVNSDSKISKLSGRQKTKLQFINLLLINSDILLLDEPTNHLDIEGRKWLEEFILSQNTIIVIVSHDRTFLNNVTNKIFEMNSGKYTLYAGNYDAYKNQKLAHDENDFLLYKSKMKDIDRLSAEANKKLSEAKTMDKKFIRGWEGPILRKKAGKKSKTAQIFIRRIEEQIMENMPEKPMQKSKIKLELKPLESSGQLILKAENVSFAYDENRIVQDANIEIWKTDRWAITGKNGSGKSTLFKLLTGELIPDVGNIKIGENVKIGYFSQEHEVLNLNHTVIDEFRKYVDMTEQDARTFLHFMLFKGDQVFQQILSLSQGEKSKLMLAILLTQGANFLILDEPTNHLDISSREVLEEALRNYEGTLCIVSHDQYFLENVRINNYYEMSK